MKTKKMLTKLTFKEINKIRKYFNKNYHLYAYDIDDLASFIDFYFPKNQVELLNILKIKKNQYIYNINPKNLTVVG